MPEDESHQYYNYVEELAVDLLHQSLHLHPPSQVLLHQSPPFPFPFLQQCLVHLQPGENSQIRTNTLRNTHRN
jgi:hypothetical protein